MKHRRRAIVFVAISFLMGDVLGAAQTYILSASSAINTAGRERMLTQRMVKSYCQIGLDVRRDEADAQLRDAMILFESQLAGLKRYAPSREIKAILAEIEADWAPVRASLSRPYDKNELRRLVELSDNLLAKSHKAVLLIEQTSGKPVLRLVNVAGRQRMLSQRVAKLYMCRQAGLNDAALLKELERAKDEFKSALQELKTAPQNTPDIKVALDNADTQWQLFEHSLANPDKPLEVMVAITSEKILNIMDRITAMYENLPGG